MRIKDKQTVQRQSQQDIKIQQKSIKSEQTVHPELLNKDGEERRRKDRRISISHERYKQSQILMGVFNLSSISLYNQQCKNEPNNITTKIKKSIKIINPPTKENIKNKEKSYPSIPPITQAPQNKSERNSPKKH